MNELECSLQKLACGKIKYFKHFLSNNKDSFSLAYNSFVEEFPYKLYYLDDLIQKGFEISKEGTRVKKYEFSSQLDIDDEILYKEFNNIQETLTFLEKEIKLVNQTEV